MLPKEQRLSRIRVEYLLRKGKLIKTKFFVVKYQGNRDVFNRFAVVVSAKVAKKAVGRNRLRRQIYEAIRNSLEAIAQREKKIDCIVIAKHQVNNSKFTDLSKDINRLFSLLT